MREAVCYWEGMGVGVRKGLMSMIGMEVKSYMDRVWGCIKDILTLCRHNDVRGISNQL